MNAADDARSVLLAIVGGDVLHRERCDEREAAQLADRCRKRMERVVESCAGCLSGVAGQQLTALFDRPEAALRAAREMLQRVAELPAPGGEKPVVRIGLAYGPVGETARNGPADALRIAAQLAALAEPGQVLLCGETRARLPAELQAALDERVVAAATAAIGGRRIFAVAGAVSARFRLRYGELSLEIDARRQVISIGRDPQCDVRIEDRRASRQHAHIERRGDWIYLVDRSSNGSYVTVHGEPEVFVRGGECLLRGRGVICFAQSAACAGADCAQFELLPD